jgi:hypothetical protein
MPVRTAKVEPTALTTKTLRSRKWGITEPDSIVLISGMPLPAAINIIFPLVVSVTPSPWSSFHPFSTEGRLIRVVIVTPPATIP